MQARRGAVAAVGGHAPDHGPGRDPIAHRDRRGDRLDGAPQPVVVPDGEHGPVHHDARERDDTGAGCEHGRADGCVQVDAAVPGRPRDVRAVERLDDDHRLDRRAPRVVGGDGGGRRGRPEDGAHGRHQGPDQRQQQRSGQDPVGERDGGHGPRVVRTRVQDEIPCGRPGDATRRRPCGGLGALHPPPPLALTAERALVAGFEAREPRNSCMLGGGGTGAPRRRRARHVRPGPAPVRALAAVR